MGIRSDWSAMCASPLLNMTPGHRIGGESERFGWIYVPPPHQAYQYTSRKVLNQHRIGGNRAFWSVIFVTPPHHDATNTHNAWWDYRAVRSVVHDSNPAGYRAIRKNTVTRLVAGYERYPIGFSCLPSGCFKKPAAKRRKTSNGKMCFHPVHHSIQTQNMTPHPLTV